MTVLIIGSKGFIGNNFISAARNKGHEVYGCDVVVEYNDPNYFQVDATNSNYEEIFTSRQFDICVNCSGAASVPDSLLHPLRDFNLNAHNVYLLLEAIRKRNKSCRFVNISSAAIYGNPIALPIGEASAISPISPYGFHKVYAERICEEFARFYGVGTCSVRIFSAYGPGLRKQLFWDLHQRIMTQGRLELLGTGEESRDFIYIDDIVKGIELVMAKGDFGAGIYNLASGRETTIREAVETFISCLGKQVPISFSNEVRKGDPLNWRADINKITQLGFSANISLKDGLQKYFEWLTKERK